VSRESVAGADESAAFPFPVSNGSKRERSPEWECDGGNRAALSHTSCLVPEVVAWPLSCHRAAREASGFPQIPQPSGELSVRGPRAAVL